MKRIMFCNGHDEESLRALLMSPFPEEWIDWKPQQAGWKGAGDKATPWVKLIAFINNRAIQDRLDDVCGIGGWRNEFVPLSSGAMLCGISILFTTSQNESLWVTKWDGAPQTEIESVKGGISSAMKRAATQWGIGRYLYDVEVKFGQIAADNDWNAKQVKPKEGKPFRWTPPRLPAWAQSGGSGRPGVVSTLQQQRADNAQRALEVVSGEVVMPGTRKHFEGHGGKRLKDIPSLVLQRGMEHLKTVNTADQYTQVIESIGEVLADRASAGA